MSICNLKFCIGLIVRDWMGEWSGYPLKTVLTTRAPVVLLTITCALTLTNAPKADQGINIKKKPVVLIKITRLLQMWSAARDFDNSQTFLHIRHQ